jgi:hypothetical protein
MREDLSFCCSHTLNLYTNGIEVWPSSSLVVVPFLHKWISRFPFQTGASQFTSATSILGTKNGERARGRSKYLGAPSVTPPIHLRKSGATPARPPHLLPVARRCAAFPGTRTRARHLHTVPTPHVPSPTPTPSRARGQRARDAEAAETTPPRGRRVRPSHRPSLTRRDPAFIRSPTTSPPGSSRLVVSGPLPPI